MQCFVNGNSSTVPSLSPVDTAKVHRPWFYVSRTRTRRFHTNVHPSAVDRVSLFFFFNSDGGQISNVFSSRPSRMRVIGTSEFSHLVECDSNAIFTTFDRRLARYDYPSLRQYKKKTGVIIYFMALRVFPAFGYQQ